MITQKEIIKVSFYNISFDLMQITSITKEMVKTQKQQIGTYKTVNPKLSFLK